MRIFVCQCARRNVRARGRTGLCKRCSVLFARSFRSARRTPPAFDWHLSFHGGLSAVGGRTLLGIRVRGYVILIIVKALSLTGSSHDTTRQSYPSLPRQPAR